uniref:Putative Zn-dependent oxidoreductase n=1 Tax=Sphingomonas sp. JE1 TaxID=1628059 RepID=A0A0D4ZZJ6_9SPHN|nr:MULTISPECIES: NADPH:quinone oxidoreductase family protein [unclassified Sphingomonas]AJW29549.1 Putative Zn-dependent oxidoreductase [Sphingomonas sp. JE1]
MKALLSLARGGPDSLVLSDIPVPEPRPGSVRVIVEACSINYPDALIIEDRYQVRPARPFAPGGEIAGVIDAVGEGVDGWAPGDRVIAVTAHGGLSEQMVVDAWRLHALPDACSFVDGSALLLTYATTLHALADRGRLVAGDSVLVLGAAGGVGLSGVEIGKVLGARVIAAVSSEDKAAIAREAGADDVVTYPSGPFDATALRALADLFKTAVGPDGADIILDPVGGDYAEPALRAIAWGGRYMVLGFPAGLPKIPLNLPLLKSCDICGVFYGAHALREPQKNRAAISRLLGWLEAGSIKPRISGLYSLAEAPDAIARLAARQAVGKLVVKVQSH